MTARMDGPGGGNCVGRGRLPVGGGAFESLGRSGYMEELMSRFFSEASAHKSKPQYMTAVWAQNEAQKAVAEKLAKQNMKPIPVLNAKPWHGASAAPCTPSRKAVSRACRRARGERAMCNGVPSGARGAPLHRRLG